MVVKNTAVNVTLGVLFSVMHIGSIQAAVSYAPPSAELAGGGPEFIAEGQLNADGNIDLVSVNANGGTISVLLGDGTGGFSRVNYTVGTQPRTVSIGDLDGDTDNDLVVTNTDTPGTGSITVFLNDGAGAFTEATGSPIDIEALAGAGAEPSAAVIAQLNSGTDAFADIAIANDVTNNVQILLGVGDGTFTTGATIAVGLKPISIAAGSVDTTTDALTDIVVANLDGNSVNVLLGDGTGAFTDATGSPFAAGNKPFSVQIGSIDTGVDSFPDIALVNHADPEQTVRVFKGAGDGTFTSMFTSGALGGRPHSVDVADLDGDADADLLVASDSTGVSPKSAVFVLLGDGSGAFSTAAEYPVSGAPNSVVSADLDGVNQVDLAVANGNTSRVDVLLSVPTSNAPVANSGFLQVASADVPTTNVQSGTLVGTDADGALLRYVVASPATNGTVTITDEATGAYTYTPTAGNYVPDSFTFTVNDGTGASAAATIQITQNDAPPVITSDGGGASAAVSVNENQTAVTTVVATDVDAGQTPTYTITGGVDAAAFSINGSTGVLTFSSAPDFEAPSDVGADNVYNVQVQAADGNGGFDSQDIAVTVVNINDAPTITSNGGGASAAIGADENQTAVTTVTATDQDLPPQTLSFSISGGADAAAFSINSSTGELTFASAPDFEAPTDSGTDNVYDVQVTVTDNGTGPQSDVQDIAVTVADVNEAPVITSDGGGATATVAVFEGTTAVTTVVAADVDAGQTLTYTITGGVDAAAFTINGSSGVLTFVSAPDFEAPADSGANNVYDVQVTVTDNGAGALTDVQDIAVTVGGVNDLPVITSNGGGASATVGADENQTAVTTVTATDQDLPPQTLSFSISGGADAAAFSINSSTGELTFVSAPDFEAPADSGADNVYDVQVTVTDNGTVPQSDVQDIAVTVADVNEAPVITSDGGGATASVSVVEGTTAVTTVVASDVDAGQTLTYSISGGADAAAFSINGGSGVLTFASAPDFDVPTDSGADNVYDVQVTASDDGAGTLTDAQDIAVTVEADSNGDGISDAGATAIGLDPQLTDTDSDGTSDAVEVGGDPANPLDTDSDGVIDALEFAAADPNTLEFVVPAPTALTLSLPDLSGQQVTLSGNGASITANNNGTTGLPLYAESNLAVADNAFTYPFGVYDFNVAAPGGTATVTLTLPAGTVIPDNAVVRKLNVSNQWQTLGATAAVIDRVANTITLTLTDNDAVFDLDNTAGIIRDPVGVAVPVPSGGGGGGGCSLSAVPGRTGFDPMLPLLTLFSLWYLRRRKHMRNVA
ncbi:VCBS repeat protein [Thiogranum longum]|uniref:VCBS repeat protein n=1 Tax=Thiogranum longum TaxID=1537524 RepID=A0A4R1HDG3_9GAMM|nr:VCBS repeat-containing protein [Thiogranum longum]TCK18190.1 VCBS repeat protein [Thiogranum longum]